MMLSTYLKQIPLIYSKNVLLWISFQKQALDSGVLCDEIYLTINK